MNNTVHLHKDRLRKKSNVFLLFIPAIIFGLILAIYLISSKAHPESKLVGKRYPTVLSETELDN